MPAKVSYETFPESEEYNNLKKRENNESSESLQTLSDEFEGNNGDKLELAISLSINILYSLIETGKEKGLTKETVFDLQDSSKKEERIKQNSDEEIITYFIESISADINTIVMANMYLDKLTEKYPNFCFTENNASK